MPGLALSIVGESLARIPWSWSRGAFYTLSENLSCCAVVCKIDSGIHIRQKKKKSPTTLLSFNTQDVCLLYQRGSAAGVYSSQGGTIKACQGQNLATPARR